MIVRSNYQIPALYEAVLSHQLGIGIEEKQQICLGCFIVALCLWKLPFVDVNLLRVCLRDECGIGTLGPEWRPTRADIFRTRYFFEHTGISHVARACYMLLLYLYSMLIPCTLTAPHLFESFENSRLVSFPSNFVTVK